MAQIYIDAAARQNPVYAAGAAVIKDENGRLEFTFDLGEMDNHEAEWATLDHALDKAVEHGIRSAIIHTDSKIIADSFDKQFVKNKKYQIHYNNIQSKLGNFDLFLVSHTPRGRNKSADNLAKEALYKYTKG
ncbi:ribonuclease HI family protein [Salinicoccus halitifaciens]|uniref:Ribonuclease HI n=1 Tax=Salinicoccus halitifaciens TaxID=1073415 RepID=A0ABV2E697_9STAP|nr:ribonuclease HI family protein [Salinicoccus halitifaciens]MCD2136993.1 ribonuclease HI family protein [Salinicoccus halitifaciens]